MKHAGAAPAELLAMEDASLLRLETILGEEEQRFGTGAPADAAVLSERALRLRELALLRQALSETLPGASPGERRRAGENQARARALKARTRALIERYRGRCTELTTALGATRRARGLVQEIGTRPAASRLDLKR